MKNTIARGTEAELMVSLWATKNGYTVCLPINHHSEYDLIVDSNSILNRIQVKRAYSVNNHGSITMCVETRRILVKHSGKKGSVTSHYSNEGYDFLIAVDVENNKFWIIPKYVASNFKAQIYLGKKMEPYLNQWNVLGIDVSS